MKGHNNEHSSYYFTYNWLGNDYSKLFYHEERGR